MLAGCLLVQWIGRAQTGVPLSEGEKTVVEGNNTFAVDLYGQLDKQEGNLFFSPASISTALAMTYAGARGETASQMAKTLHFDLESSQFHAAMGALLRRTTNASNAYQLHEGNALWLQKGFAFRQEFLKLTTDDYGAVLEHVDFLRAAEAARVTINNRVAEQTNGKIKDLIPSKALSAATRLVLTNAIYFKGDWQSPFKKESTSTADFHLTEQTVAAQVPFMHERASFKYYDGGSFQSLAMPYKSGDLSMIMFLPASNSSLAIFESSLSGAKMTQWLGELEGQSQEVDLTLPKFKATLQFELSRTLEDMGMKRAFSREEADFSGITKASKLCLSAVIHKAYIAVDEKGSEAAAATAVGIKAFARRAPQPPPIIFRADHPFIFLIRDNRSGSILFLGRMSDPSK